MIKPTSTTSKTETKTDFNAISLRLASPERIREWSYGEVTKPETINYRTGRSERGGLFDERIFGPERDYECYCGKYRRIRYRDIICERCGVEVTNSIVRRERMGHIELAGPVTHIWFVRGVPSRLGLFLNLSMADLEKVIYFAGYIITKINREEQAKMLRDLDVEYKQRFKSLKDERSQAALKQTMLGAKKTLESLTVGAVLDEVTYHRLSLKYSSVFEADIGAEALHAICRESNLESLLKTVGQELEQASKLKKNYVQKRYNLIKAMKRSGIRPEWMFLSVISVIPPDLRPMVALDGGRYATSDVNDLYRRVINRNNRLKKLKELDAPEVILRNEKRILQEAVDALIDNSMRRTSGAVNQAQRRPLKSLADGLKGKQGRFRQNLLGKRVDYSGRSVIVVGPELKLSQCGLPKLMALELFRPFVISKILERELAYNIRGAGRLIDDKAPEVWAILEEVIKDKYIFLNRAPTLHRLGIQAFKPVLVEGSAIRIHPLVCSAFNADFDGDQMAVHVPLGKPAQREAAELLAADRNILKPGSGNPIVNLKLDIILGCYWASKLTADPASRGEGQVFGTPDEAITAHNFGLADLQAKIKILFPETPKYRKLAEQLVETSVGRILFNETLPPDFPFVNKEITAKEINRIVEELTDIYGIEKITPILDRVKDFGFRQATLSGVTWGIDDVTVPPSKREIIDQTLREAKTLEEQYNDGLLSAEERYRMSIRLWTSAKNKIEKVLLSELDPNGSVSTMLTSGARGSGAQISQMSGMKGLIINPAGHLIDFPIIPSYKEGLSPLEYFITTHGSRKTLTDTALNTAKAGYLTRRLVYVAENVIVAENDCGDTEGQLVTVASLSGFDRSLNRLWWGRVLAKDLKAPSGEVLFAKGKLLGRAEVALAEKHQVAEAAIRTVLSCRLVHGICQKCYGLDLGRGSLVALGEPVGIVAAQAIGEPGTQLTMRTKHTGGVDVGGDIVGGLPRVEEIFERRRPQNPAVIAQSEGLVTELNREEGHLTVTPAANAKSKSAPVTYHFPKHRNIFAEPGGEVTRGQLLTDGPADLQELFKFAGLRATEEYIIGEINKIYELQGAAIARKHIEIIIRQMFSRRRVKQPGDTSFDVGEVVEQAMLADANESLPAGATPAAAETVLLGISEVSLTTNSFISAVSFAQATKVLIRTAIRGGLDRLRGLKENVIIGRLIPAGTGLNPNYERESLAAPPNK